MIEYTIDGKIYKVPASIDQVTIGSFIKFRHIDRSQDIQIIEWALGCQLNVRDSKRTQNEIAGLITILDGLVKEIYGFIKSDLRIKVPDSINVLGLDVEVKPNFIQSLPYWGSVKCREIMAAEKKRSERDGDEFDPTDSIPEVIGHYLYSLVTKSSYDERKADEFAKDVVSELPMVEAIHQQFNEYIRIR